MDKHPTPEPETLDSSTPTYASISHWIESGLIFAVSTPGIESQATGSAIGITEGGRELGTDDMNEPHLSDRPTSCGPGPFASTIDVVAAPEGSHSCVAALSHGTTAGGGDTATGIDPWDVYALACCWPLGRSADVHFTTNMQPKVLAGALRIYLQIQPDELLLAIIDRRRGEPRRRLRLDDAEVPLGWPAAGLPPRRSWTSADNSGRRWAGRSPMARSLRSPAMASGLLGSIRRPGTGLFSVRTD